jgi:hypothetical protein
VIGEELWVFDAGPFVLVAVPNTEFASTCGMRVPSPQEEIVRVNVLPEDALMEKVHPVAVPAFEKSEFATLLTICEKVIEYEIDDDVFVGVDCEVVKLVGVGAFRYVTDIEPLPDL